VAGHVLLKQVKRRLKIMLKGLFTIAALLWILTPNVSAQNMAHPAGIIVTSDDFSENLCAPFEDFYEEPEALALVDEPRAIALDHDQMEKLRIQLLEHGWDPGFDPDAIDADARLAEALRGFQAQFDLPVTGQADAATLALLSIF
jgi:hypothetical protein